VRDWASKLPGAALRLAGLLHLARHATLLPELSPEIEEPEIRIALEICEALTSHAIAVFNIVSEDPVLTKAKRVLHWIVTQQPLEISKRICFRAHQPHLFEKVEDLDVCLKVLADHYMIRVAERKTGGRPSEVIQVNPALKESR